MSSETLYPTPALPEINEKTLPDRIGIWDLVNENGEYFYRRDDDSDNRFHWSNTKKFSLDSDKYRVIFFGESVARGYFYDPFYSPATALDHLLNLNNAMDAEVLDLARTNLGLVELDTLCKKAKHLNPDAMVIFAGNNWIISLRDSVQPEDYDAMIALQQKEGSVGIMKWFSEKAKTFIEDYFKNLHRIGQELNIPMVLMIPEFNLLDWQSHENEQIPFVNTREQREEFESLLSQCKVAAGQKNFEELKSLAQAMIELDPTNPLGYEYTAKCLISEGNMLDAREHLYKAMDMGIYYRTVSKPRCYSFIQDHIRSMADEYNIQLVDLPKVFEAYNGNPLPGGELFLDYCHLTDTGINLSMTAVANKLREFNNKEVLNFSAIQEIEALQVPDSVKAHACFLAAVHNAHFGQPYERLEALCKEAVSYSDEVVTMMPAFADFATRDMPNYMTKSFGDIIDSDYLQQYEGGFGFSNKENQKVMDLKLVDAIVSALEEKKPELKDTIDTLRLEQHSVYNRKADLLLSMYSEDSYYNYNGFDYPYYISRKRESIFYMFAQDGLPVTINATFRTPNCPDSQSSLVIKCNGHEVASFDSSDSWKPVNFTVPAEYVIKGLNTLTFHWPLMDQVKPEEAGGHSPEKKLYQWYSKNFPIFGQIHTADAIQQDQKSNK